MNVIGLSLCYLRSRLKIRHYHSTLLINYYNLYIASIFKLNKNLMAAVFSRKIVMISLVTILIFTLSVHGKGKTYEDIETIKKNANMP